MKISAALVPFILAQTEAGKGKSDVCQACDENIEDFNTWHKNEKIVCSRYTDPRFANFQRGACKECKIQCVPNEDACPGVSALEAGFWNRPGKKLTAQYIERAEQMAAERALQRRQNQFEKEQAKYEKTKQKMEEKQAKAENKAFKKADWQAWREDKRQKNEAKRAQRKQDKKDKKAAAKAAKELRKQQREQKRALADANKVLFAFYADLEEHYISVCPDMFLIEDNKMARSFEKFKANQLISE